MKPVFFILGIHNHQPVGNFDFICENAFQKAYWPFLQALTRHPHIRVCLHYSGILWEWLESSHPEMIDLCHSLLEKKQIELLSGGFYEPILTVIPDIDKIGQLKKMGSYLDRKFGIRPRGVWLAERVWEPGLPKFIQDAGLEYVIVDDRHFLATGLEQPDLYGYYLTDDQGRVVKVFPGSKELRYLIPFQSPERVIEYLGSIRDLKTGDLAMMGDDGEKFGIWPGTYRWVYEQGWLESFFGAIEKNSDWIRMCTYSEYIEERTPLGQIYLPTASYAEMEEWALPVNAQEQFHSLIDRLSQANLNHNAYNFVRGGLWRNFLCKYREGNIIYNRMLQVSRKIHDAASLVDTGTEGGDAPEWLTVARDELWKGQCNDAYWHGLFGGLYLPHLRSALYEHIIRADNLIEQHRHSIPHWVEWHMKDMNHDGFEEIEINTDTYCLFIDPHGGGAIYEWDFRPKCFNVINSFIRRPEGYHQKILRLASKGKNAATEGVRSIHDREGAQVDGLEKMLVYDRYSRNTLMDHFIPPSTTFEQFSQLNYREIGDFLQRPYSLKIERDKDRLEIRLTRQGGVEPSGMVSLSKTLIFSPGDTFVRILYDIDNLGKTFVDALFGVEFNFNLLAGRADDRFFRLDERIPAESYLASRGDVKGINRICLVDKSMGLEIGIHAHEKTGLWRFPIETASNSESGFEKVYQSSTLFLHWPLLLREGGHIRLSLDCWVREIP